MITASHSKLYRVGKCAIESTRIAMTTTIIMTAMTTTTTPTKQATTITDELLQ